MLRIRNVVIICGLLLCLSQALRAQGAEATITFPSNNATEVIIQPSITIQTHFPIDSSSIVEQYTYADSGSSVAPRHWPTLLLLPKIYADSLTDSVKQRLSVPGEYEFVNDTTLTFTPTAPLLYGVKYIAVVKDLAVVVDTAVGPGSPDTVSVDETSIYFTTVLPTHAIVGTNIAPNNALRCSDTIFFVFNRKLTTDTSATGPFVHLDRIDSTHYLTDSTDTVYTTSASIKTWLYSSDSSVLCVKGMSQLESGKRYRLSVETSKLTGDTLDDVKYIFYVKDRFKMTVITADEDTTHSPPSSDMVSSSGESFHTQGETVRLSAIDENEDYAFVRWECPGFDDIDSNTASTITFSQSCSALQDLNVTAVFRLKDTVSVTIRDTLHSWVHVYRLVGDSLVYAGDTGSYTVPPNRSLRVFGGTDTAGYQFNEWKSNTTPFNGIPKPSFLFKNNGKFFNVGGVIIGPNMPIGIPIGPPVFPKCSLCTIVGWNEPIGTSIRHGVDPNTVLTVNPPAGTCGENDPNLPGNPPCPVGTVVTATRNDDCIAINEVIVMDGAGNEVYHLTLPPGSEISSWNSAAAQTDGLGRGGNLGLQKTNPATQVLFGVIATIYQLDVTTTLMDARILEEGQIGLSRDVRVGIWLVDGSNETFLYYTPNQSELTTTTTDHLYIACDEVVRARAEYKIREEGFSFFGWKNLGGYTYPTPQSDETFTFTMDQNRQIEAQFKEHFRLRKVGIYQADATSTPTWYNVKDLRGTMPEDLNVWLATTNSIHYGTKIHLKFNDAVNTGTLGYGLNATELSEKIDERYMRSYDGNSPYMTSADADHEIILELVKDGLGIPRGEQFQLGVGGSIYNSGNLERLDNPANLLMETEMPGLDINIVSVTPIKSSGDGDVELYTIYEGAIHDRSNSLVARGGGNLPDTEYPPGIAAGEAQTYSGPTSVASANKMDKYGAAGLRLTSYDNDGAGGIDFHWDWGYADDTAVWIGGILIGVGGFAGGVGLAALAAALGVTSEVVLGLILVLGIFGLIGGLVALAWAIVEGIQNNADDFLGEAGWAFLWGPKVWFGGHPKTKWLQKRPGTDNGSVGYEVDFKLKK